MTVKVEASTLSDALKIVHAAIPRASALPILQCIRLTAADGKLALCASSLDLTIETEVPAHGEIDIVLPGTLTRDAVAQMHDVVLIDDTDQQVTLTDSRGAMVLRAPAVRDWPAVRRAEGESVVLKAETVEQISKVLYAAGTDTNRPILMGVYFDGTSVVATDSYRCAVAEIPEPLPSALVPASAVAMVIANVDSDVSLTLDSLCATFTSGATSWTVTLIPGNYVAYRQLIRESSEAWLKLDRASMLDALKRASLLADGDSRAVLIHRVADELQVVGRKDEVGESAVTINGALDIPAIQFNARFFSDLLKVCENDDIEIGVVDHMKPTITREENVTHLLMPIRILH